MKLQISNLAVFQQILHAILTKIYLIALFITTTYNYQKI